MLFTGMALFVDLFRLAAYGGDEAHGEHKLKGWLIFFNLLEFAVMVRILHSRCSQAREWIQVHRRWIQV
jgi:hypothetical protein